MASKIFLGTLGNNPSWPWIRPTKLVLPDAWTNAKLSRWRPTWTPSPSFLPASFKCQRSPHFPLGVGCVRDGRKYFFWKGLKHAQAVDTILEWDSPTVRPSVDDMKKPIDSESRQNVWIIPLSADIVNRIGGHKHLPTTDNRAKRENFKWLFKLLFSHFILFTVM